MPTLTQILQKRIEELEKRISVLENTKPVINYPTPVNPIYQYPICTCNTTATKPCPMHGVINC